MLQLTDSQNEGLQFITDTLLKTISRAAILQGSAGTGKTFLTNSIILKLIPHTNKQNQIAISAPTHKALSVLREKVSVRSPNVIFSTIHSLLQMQRVIDPETGEESFISVPNKKYPPLSKVKFLIVDEASMIDSYVANKIKEYGKFCKILYILDGKQLPPVGESITPILLEDFPTFTLTEIVRQGKGNPIIDLSYNLELLKTRLPNVINGKGYVFTDDHEKCIDRISTGEFIYLAYTNPTVNTANFEARKKKFFYPTDIEVGEIIVLQKPYGELKNNAILKVLKIQEVDKTIQYRLVDGKTITIKLKSLFVNTDNGSIHIIHNDSKKVWTQEKRKARDLAKEKKLSWINYVIFSETFADFKYGYASSIHKSQGSTYSKVIIDYKDVMKNRDVNERNALFYTAITRASDFVVIKV